jgi:hypothetical protein
MSWQDYQIAAGFENVAGLTLAETLLRVPIRATPVPLGSVARVALSGERYLDGQQVVIWRLTAIRWIDLSAFVTAFWGDWNTPAAELTLRTRQADQSFANFNAYGYLPQTQLGEMETRNLRHILDVMFQFYIVASL